MYQTQQKIKILHNLYSLQSLQNYLDWRDSWTYNLGISKILTTPLTVWTLC